jgi:hypothetical protein
MLSSRSPNIFINNLKEESVMDNNLTSPFIVYPVPENDIPSPGKIKHNLGAVMGTNPIGESSEVIVSDKPKRGRPRKDTTVNVSGSEISTAVQSNSTPAIIPNSAADYQSRYSETDMVLKGAIAQTDIILNDVNNDIQHIRSSKAMTSKYKYITDLSATMSSLIATKISAARELNNSITHANDFEIKMQREIKAARDSEQNDDKKIMDMYNAFVSMPMGTYTPGMSLPTMQDVTMSNPGMNTVDISINNAGGYDAGYQSYVNNMTPVQNMMRYENDPNIKTVVVYDQSNGNKWFDIIDVRTGNSVPNVEKPDPFLLDDTRPDLVNGIARNANIDATYPLIVVGEKSSLMEY